MNTTEIHLIICLFVFSFVIAIEHPEELVNLLAGSFTDGQRFSTGNTLPLVGRPWGFNHWAPQTIETGRSGSSWWFQGNEHMMTWLRCTHQPSPWIGDWGYFLVSPQVGNVQQNPHHFWEPRGAVLKPYLFDAIVAPFNIRIELTPTDHAAYLRVTFPESSEHGEKHICFSEARWDSNANNAKDGSKVITGRAVQVHSERMAVTNFNMHIRVESNEATSVTNQADLKCFAFARDASVVHVRMATSLISADQAAVNLNRELRMGKPFDDVLLESKMVWNKLMRRVDVVEAGDVSESTNRHLSVFYTGLYRGLMFPRRIDETTAAGKVVHYSPYDPHGGVHEGVLVTDNGFWDTFRTVYPMLSLIYPDHLGVLVQGWLNAFKEGGWLPSWASPGYRNCMVGTFADVVVADAIVKGVRGFDLDTAREAILKDSFEEAPRYVGSAAGKEGLSEYSSKGYLAYSNGGGEVVSRTLDYGFADYSTAQALLVLAEKDELLGDELRRKAKTLLARATAAYTNLFDKNHGLMVPKNRDGGFSPSFSSIEWGNGYTEGNSWHHSFPPYAIIDSAGSSNLRSGQSVIEGGLVTLYGGKKPLLARLHQMLKTSSNFRVGSYGNEIHEMTEARAVAMGQYGHNNQPSHHILYLFALLGERRMTEELVRRVMDRAYGMDFFAGDEDNGEMGSWFVLSALGLYVVVPGTRDYVLGSPLFRHVRINRDAEVPFDHYYEEKYVPADSSPKQYLDIFALGTSASVLHVESVQLNERRVDGATVDDASLQRHGFIRFVMEGESTGVDEVAALHATTSFPGAAVARRGSVADQPRPSDVSAETHLKEQLLAQASTIKRLSAQLQSQQGGESQMTNTRDRAPRYSVLSVAFTLLLVLVLAFCLSKLLEMLGVFSGSSELATDSSHISHKALSLNDFNSPLRGAATREPSSNYGTSSRNVFFTCYLYSCSMCRSCALWLSSDSISSTVAGGSAATNVAMIKWGKAQSHTV